MQIMIDLTAANDAATLRRIAALLLATADNAAVLVARPDVPALALATLQAEAASRAAPSVPEGTATAPVPSPPAAIVPPPPPPAPPTVTTSAAPSAAATEQPPITNLIAPMPATDVQLDKRGFPHDARIHSATPSINKSDGIWRGRRGLDNTTLEAVEAELRAKGYGISRAPSTPPAPTGAIGVPVPPPPLRVPLPPSVPSPPAGVVAAPNAPAPSVMVPPPPPGAAGVLPGNGASPPVDMFRALMAKLKDKTGENGPLRREIMQPIYVEFGVSGPQDFHKKRDQIPALLARIDQLLGV